MFAARLLSAQATAVPPQSAGSPREQARNAIHEFERAVFRYLPPQSAKVQGEDSAVGVRCSPVAGQKCLLGRTLPCVFWDFGRMLCDRSDSQHRAIEISREQERLLYALANAQALAPGDTWIAGQRAFYAVMANRPTEAIAAVRSCGSATRCQLLNVMILQRTGALARAEAALHALRASLDQTERCRWENISSLLPDNISESYGKLHCGDPRRDAFEQRFWHLTDPSWTTSGNDRWVEHWVRQLEATLQGEWGGVNRGIDQRGPVHFATDSLAWIRNGQSDSFWIERRATANREYAQTRALMGRPLPPGTISRDSKICNEGEGVDVIARDSLTSEWVTIGYIIPTDKQYSTCVRAVSTLARYHFVPSSRALAFPDSATAADWQLTMNQVTDIRALGSPAGTSTQSPRVEHYSPLYAHYTAALASAQAVRFLRGDSTLIAAATRLRDNDIQQANQQIDVKILAATDSGTLTASAETIAEEAPYQWVGTVTVQEEPTLLGIEAMGERRSPSTPHGESALWRTRMALGPPLQTHDGVGLSDLLLYRASAGRLTTPVDYAGGALDAMLPSVAVSAQTGVGTLWEVYGLQPTDTVAYELTVTPVLSQTGMLGRLRSLLARKQTHPVVLTWTQSALRLPEVARNRSVTVESVLLNTAGLRPMEYELRLTALVGARRLETKKRLVIE